MSSNMPYRDYTIKMTVKITCTSDNLDVTRAGKFSVASRLRIDEMLEKVMEWVTKVPMHLELNDNSASITLHNPKEGSE